MLNAVERILFPSYLTSLVKPFHPEPAKTASQRKYPAGETVREPYLLLCLLFIDRKGILNRLQPLFVSLHNQT